MLAMWTDRAAAPLNIVHLGFGFGAVFANFLVKPYLNEPSDALASPSNGTSTLPWTTPVTPAASNIEVPYRITSLICLVIGVGHLLIFMRERRVQRQSLACQKDERNYEAVSTAVERNNEPVRISPYSPRACGNGSFVYGLLMSSLWVIYMFFLSGNDQTFGKFYFAYLKSPEFGISTSNATWGMILYWSSYSVRTLPRLFLVSACLRLLFDTGHSFRSFVRSSDV
jgi:hypothetical protein